MSATFRALGDPTRCALVERLAHGPATVSDLAAPYEMSLPAITKHLTVLERAGLIRRERVGRHVRCTLQPQALTDVEAWADRHHRFWTGALRRLDAVLASTPLSAGTPQEEL